MSDKNVIHLKDKSDDAMRWTAEDVLEMILADIRSGKLNPKETAIVMHEDGKLRVYQAQSDRSSTYFMLAAGQRLLMNEFTDE